MWPGVDYVSHVIDTSVKLGRRTWQWASETDTNEKLYSFPDIQTCMAHLSSVGV
jgi:hypothetical protein